MTSNDSSSLSDALAKNENYFIFWMEMAKKTAEDETLQYWTQELYQEVSPPSNKLLEECKNSENIKPNKLHEQFQELDLKKEKEGHDFESCFETFCDDSCAEIIESSDQEKMTLGTAVTPLIESFLHIKCGDINWAKRNIIWVGKYMALTNSCQDYTLGAQYLSTLLKMDILIKEGRPIPESIRKNFLSTRYENLPDKGKVVVWLAKLIFIELIDSTNKISSIEILKQLSTLDPSNWFWHYSCSIRMRFNKNKYWEPPHNEELEEIGHALNLAPEDVLGICKARLCQALSEIAHWSSKFEVEIGPFVFHSKDDILKFILKQKSGILQEIQNQGYGELVRYGEIYSNLPDGNSDYNLAEKCYEICMAMKPWRSKAFHKMGLLKLKMRKDKMEAIKCLRDAVEKGPKNIPVLIDLIKTLMGSFAEYNEEILRLIKIGRETESNKYEYFLTFLEGCHRFLQGDKNSAVNTWIGCSEYPQSFRLGKDLESTRHLHQWSPQNLTLENVRTEVEEMIRNTASVEEKKKLQNLLRKFNGSGNRKNWEKHPQAKKTKPRSQNRTSLADSDSNWRKRSIETA